ncbi:hypothetical protein NFI96_018702, partial [Prochilodus magdalenae]
VITHTLDQLMNSTEILKDAATADQSKLVFYGTSLLNATETLVSMLVTKTNDSYSENISLPLVQAAVFVLGLNDSLKQIPQLKTSRAYLDINMSVENKEIDAVLFLSYTNMSSFLKPDLFKPSDTTEETMMSTVVTVKLLSTTNQATPKQQSKQTANSTTNGFVVTLKHIATVEPNSTLHCVNWRKIEWVEGNCKVFPINSTHTTCHCVHPGTFALIMQTSVFSTTPRSLDMLNTVAVAVGLFFLTLALLTFALCQRKMKMINTALINLCISLFLAHLLLLLTQKFLIDISFNHLACKVIAGVLHFLFLSAFVWMFIDAVLLFIIVKNLTEIRPKQEILSWKCLIAIGYVIPLFVVGVSVGLFPDGYGSEQCWLKGDKDFIWSFLGPVCFILGVSKLYEPNVSDAVPPPAIRLRTVSQQSTALNVAMIYTSLLSTPVLHHGKHTVADPISDHGGEGQSASPLAASICTEGCGDQSVGRLCAKICFVHVYPQGHQDKKLRTYAILNESLIHYASNLSHPGFFLPSLKSLHISKQGTTFLNRVSSANVLLFIIIGFLVVSTLRKLNNENLRIPLRSDEIKLVKSVMLKTMLQFVVIGCPWFLGFFTEKSEVIKVLFLIFNSQQGTFIFFVHCVLNHEVRYHLLSDSHSRQLHKLHFSRMPCLLFLSSGFLMAYL